LSRRFKPQNLGQKKITTPAAGCEIPLLWKEDLHAPKVRASSPRGTLRKTFVVNRADEYLFGAKTTIEIAKQSERIEAGKDLAVRVGRRTLGKGAINLRLLRAECRPLPGGFQGGQIECRGRTKRDATSRSFVRVPGEQETLNKDPPDVRPNAPISKIKGWPAVVFHCRHSKKFYGVAKGGDGGKKGTRPMINTGYLARARHERRSIRRLHTRRKIRGGRTGGLMLRRMAPSGQKASRDHDSLHHCGFNACFTVTRRLHTTGGGGKRGIRLSSDNWDNQKASRFLWK